MEDEKLILSPDTTRSNRVPPGQRLTEKFPVLHHGPVPEVDLNQWRFSLTGLVKREQVLNYQEFLALPQVKVFSDIHCVTTWSRLDNLWEGVSTAVLRNLVEIRPEARFVLVHAAGGFTTNLSLDDFWGADVLFALKHNGAPLTREHGAPVRLVVPRLYFWKSAKWVTGVEFRETEQLGFWESHGYHRRGDPWKEERYSS
jgi:DMSO/TMAO reductase YedYZ molybdopterin-dependent catalytic subunit